MKKIGLIFIILLLLIGCEGSKAYPVEAEEDQIDISLADMKGVQIQLDEAAQEVVILSPVAGKILESLGARDRISGIQADIDYKKASGLKKYRKDEILTGLVQADLFVVLEEDLTSKEREAFYKRGQNLIILSIEDEGDLYRAIEILGRGLGKNLAAVEEVRHLESLWQKLIEESSYKGSIYLESQGQVLGRSSYMSKSLEKLGFDNVNEGRSLGVFSRQEIEKLSPDYILVLGQEDSETRAKFKDMKVLYWPEEGFYGPDFVEEFKKLLRALG